MAKEFDDPNEPFAYVQWKGTEICMDFYCLCGTHCHFDGSFAYTVRCPHCSTIWEMPHYIFPRKACDETDKYWLENPRMMKEYGSRF